jgi:hypothetical protein
MYSEFFVFSNTNSSMAISLVPLLFAVASNCVGPSLSVSSSSTVLTGTLGVSFTCLGFLNGLLSEFKCCLERAEHALALDCHVPISILTELYTQRTRSERQRRRREGAKERQTQGGEKERCYGSSGKHKARGMKRLEKHEKIRRS